MKKQSPKNATALKVAKSLLSYPAKKTDFKKQKYIYTEKDLGEDLLYMGLNTPVYFTQRF